MSLLRRRNRPKAPERKRFELPELDWRHLGRGAAAVAALGGLAGLLSLALNQPVERVLLEGSFQRVSPVEVEQVVRRAIGGGFLTADLDRLRTGIEALAWVDRARVQRRWPDALAVEVVEQVPAARWSEDGLLNIRGELFVSGARHLPPELPRLDGPAGSEAIVAQRYLAVQERLAEQGLRLAALTLDPRGAWDMTLSNGVSVRLGRRDVDARMDRFIRVAAEVIAGRAADIEHVDMRYSNGFSIGWRAGAEPRPNRAAAVKPEPRELDTDA
jgi:cell division protein FtsQ